VGNDTVIKIVKYDDISSSKQDLGKRCGPSSADGYALWKAYHDELCAVARRFGKVGYKPSESPDFWHGGDWYHELYDVFMISDPANFSPYVFAEFQEVVAKRHPDASMVLAGGAMSLEDWRAIPALYGLEVFIRPSTIHVGWMLEERDGCIRKLRDAGVNFESWHC
jgi:hypothetical protein